MQFKWTFDPHRQELQAPSGWKITVREIAQDLQDTAKLLEHLRNVSNEWNCLVWATQGLKPSKTDTIPIIWL